MLRHYHCSTIYMSLSFSHHGHPLSHPCTWKGYQNTNNRPSVCRSPSLECYQMGFGHRHHSHSSTDRHWVIVIVIVIAIIDSKAIHCHHCSVYHYWWMNSWIAFDKNKPFHSFHLTYFPSLLCFILWESSFPFLLAIIIVMPCWSPTDMYCDAVTFFFPALSFSFSFFSCKLISLLSSFLRLTLLGVPLFCLLFSFPICVASWW